MVEEPAGAAAEVPPPGWVRELPLVILRRLSPEEPAEPGEDETPGYLAISTAPDNVEDPWPLGLAGAGGEAPERPLRASRGHLEEIARRLVAGEGEGEPELVIAVHGFANDRAAAERWYREIHAWWRGQPDLRARNLVFLGYRWPSESLFGGGGSHLRQAWAALPTLPRGLLVASLLLALAMGVRLLAGGGAGPLALLVPALGLAATMLTLVLLRLVVYFRDTSRSALHGAPDLVELVRQLDRAIEAAGGGGRVGLSFLAHSLGNSVVTEALRVLVDAFEPESVGGLSGFSPDKSPSATLGRRFRLERLVLVAPDIPVEAVIPRRANVLRSALRRMRESHLFTNEGDLALRLASTAANYFSFPARTRFSGYRLGNLSLRHFRDCRDRRGSEPTFGLQADQAGRPGLPVNHLEIRSSRREHRNLEEPPFAPWVARGTRQVTNLLSYYDCTDAICDGKGVVSLARRRPALNLIDYICLTLAYLRFSLDPSRGVDTHGGYFRAASTRTLIYRLAFAGFDDLLATLAHDRSDLDAYCRDCQIQLALSIREQERLVRPSP